MSKGKVEFNVVSQEQYPALPEFPSDDEYVDPIYLLGNKLKMTLFCTEKEGYSFRSGIFFDTDKIYSTDVNRLSIVLNDTLSESFIVPSSDLYALLPYSEMSVKKKGNLVFFKSDNTSICISMLACAAPEISAIASLDFDYEIEFDREELLEVIEKAFIVNKYEINLIFRTNTLCVKSIGDRGTFEEEIEFDKYIDESIIIGFNPNYLIEPLKAIEEEEITLKIAREHRKPLSINTANFTHIIMPLVKPNI